MNIEAFLLCDCATDQQGKLNVLGAFENIFTKQIPALHPACAVAARIRFSQIERGSHKVKINIIDEDGKEVGPKIEGDITVNIGKGEDSTVANFILNIQGLKLENYGEYRIDLAIDGRQEGVLPFHVRQIPPQF